jgi:hypothetical protein
MPRGHLPWLRVVPDLPMVVDAPPSPSEVVADLMALIDAGVVRAVPSRGAIRYAPMESDTVCEADNEASLVTHSANSASMRKVGER